MGHPAHPRLCHDWGAPSFPEEAIRIGAGTGGNQGSSSPRRKIGA
jgi:hypothetical protein